MATKSSEEIEDVLSPIFSNNGFRPPPKVVEFVEPGQDRARKKAGLLHLKRKHSKPISKSSSQEDNDYEFQSIAREIREFGVTGLSRKEKRKYEDQKAQALGGKAPKGQKMPYPILMRQIKRQKEREKEQREREHAMGIFKKKSDKKKPRTSMGRWVDNSSRGLQASVGKFKAGVQRLSKTDLQRIKSTKR